MNELAMQNMLKESSLHVILILLSKALSRAGFGDVEIMGRRTTKQKSRYGGHEILCRTRVGTLETKVLVKVINDGVRVRMLDEAAGAVVRTGADAGIVVTTHALRPELAAATKKYRPVRVEVLDGQALATLLRQFNLGTRGKDDVDYAFFAALEEVSERLVGFIAREGA